MGFLFHKLFRHQGVVLHWLDLFPPHRFTPTRCSPCRNQKPWKFYRFKTKSWSLNTASPKNQGLCRSENPPALQLTNNCFSTRLQVTVPQFPGRSPPAVVVTKPLQHPQLSSVCGDSMTYPPTGEEREVFQDIQEQKPTVATTASVTSTFHPKTTSKNIWSPTVTAQN